MYLYFQQQQFSFEELARYQALTNRESYLAQILQFCRDWLLGKETFHIFTSGSTGTPKSITISRKQMQESASATAKALNLQVGDTAFICLNTNYIAGKMMLVRGLEIGMNMIVVEPSANPFANINTPLSRIDFCAFVPLQLHTLLKEGTQIELLNRAKAIIVGGAAVNAALEDYLQVISAPIYATYGMTETVSHIALKRLNGKEKSPYYQVLPNTQIGQDERGCLTIVSPVTHFEKIITNDKVKLIDSQHFEWIGRVDNVINSGGVKIQVEKIENEIDKLFAQLGILQRFVVIGLPDSKLGEVATLVVERDSLMANIADNELLSLLKNKLSKYEIPKTVLYLPAFPETETNKVNKLKIKELLINKINYKNIFPSK